MIINNPLNHVCGKENLRIFFIRKIGILLLGKTQQEQKFRKEEFALNEQFRSSNCVVIIVIFVVVANRNNSYI